MDEQRSVFPEPLGWCISRRGTALVVGILATSSHGFFPLRKAPGGFGRPVLSYCSRRKDTSKIRPVLWTEAEDKQPNSPIARMP